jgi:predicted RNA-binding protein with TRAM domain
MAIIGILAPNQLKLERSTTFRLEISYKGDGIARIQGFVIFVKNGKTGENVKVKVNSVGSRFAIAEIVN